MIKYLLVLVSLLLGDFVLAASTSKALTIGYVPVVFPRDPAEANFVEEHTILGQILEPILDSDQNGGLDDGIAENWVFDNSGTTITMKLKSGRLFSNGKTVSANDVVYSIERHLHHPKSQSAQFLKDVLSIKATTANTIQIKLAKKNPAILKALTRDQLGIVPKDWKFDPHSNEPFIGSGPYRAVKEDGTWFLVANEHFNGKHPAVVKKFQLIFYQDIDFKIPLGSLPDIIPDLSERALGDITSNSHFKDEKYKIQNKLSFTQTSFWIYPTSALYKSEKDRIWVASVLNKAILDFAKKRHYTLATGMIPVGIQGHLPQRPLLQTATKPNKKISITLAYLPGVFGEFISDSGTINVFSQSNIELNAVSFNPQTISSLKDKMPDIVTGSWAGGFNDPVGFLGLLNVLLNKPFEEYLHAKGINLKDAMDEENWSLRAEKFRLLANKAITDGLNIPGWKTNTYFVSRPNITEVELEIRYTPRFSNIRVK